MKATVTTLILFTLFSVHTSDASTDAPIRIFTAHPDGVHCVAFSPDGSTLAGGGDDGVRVWDSQTGALIHTLTGHTDDVISVAYSPDGSILASGSRDNTVRVWDTQTGALIHTLTGHTYYVKGVSFQSGRRHLGKWELGHHGENLGYPDRRAHTYLRAHTPPRVYELCQ